MAATTQVQILVWTHEFEALTELQQNMCMFVQSCCRMCATSHGITHVTHTWVPVRQGHVHLYVQRGAAMRHRLGSKLGKSSDAGPLSFARDPMILDNTLLVL